MNSLQASAKEALQRLEDGNARFVAGDRCIDTYLSHTKLDEHLTGQAPYAIVPGCSDSRVPIEIIFDAGPGDLFVIRDDGLMIIGANCSLETGLVQFFDGLPEPA